jgi:hypothetical protein
MAMLGFHPSLRELPAWADVDHFADVNKMVRHLLTDRSQAVFSALSMIFRAFL